jgi:uncharacterized membrane protein
MYCKNCGKEVLPEAVYCMNCGARPVNGRSFCQNCGSATAYFAEICIRCGVRLRPEPVKKAPPLSPGVLSAYKYGWRKLWPSFWILLLIGIVGQVLTAAIELPLSFVPFLPLLAILVTVPLSTGIAYCYLQAAECGSVKFETMFSGFKQYWNSIGAMLLYSLIITGGLILLIVPGIIFSCKLAFVPYLVVDRNLGPTDAISKSWKMTDGHAMEVFLIGLLAIPIYLAGLLCLILGVVVAAQWVSISLASLYYAVREEQEPTLIQNTEG